MTDTGGGSDADAIDVRWREIERRRIRDTATEAAHRRILLHGRRLTGNVRCRRTAVAAGVRQARDERCRRRRRRQRGVHRAYERRRRDTRVARVQGTRAELRTRRYTGTDTAYASATDSGTDARTGDGGGGRTLVFEEMVDEVAAVFDLTQVGRHAAIECEDLCPNEDEHLAQLLARRLQQLEDVRKDADTEREIDRPRAIIHETRQQLQGAESMIGREENLQHDRQLHRWRTVRTAGALAECVVRRRVEPYLESGQLILEEGRRRERRAVLRESLALTECDVTGEIPTRPERVLVRRRQLRHRHHATIVRDEDALGEEEVTKQTRDEEILTKQLLEHLTRQNIPGDRVGDRRKDPIQLAERRLAIVRLANAGQVVDQIVQSLSIRRRCG